MLYHHHGYVSRDPRNLEPVTDDHEWDPEIPEKLDVLIAGAGPAGMMLAAQLSMFPSVTTRLTDRRPHRLILGHADGVQARSVETFQAFGFQERIVAEAYKIEQMNFWAPDKDNPKNIVRTNFEIDDATNLSEFPHIIVNQARVLDYLAEFAKNSPSRFEPNYGWELVSMVIQDEGEYPVEATLKCTLPGREGEEKVVHTKYLVGADGARSLVRKSIGRELSGAQANQAWGVMDILFNTDFPDIRTKCAIQSQAGSILLIPREGGTLVRLYVDLGETSPDDRGKIRETTVEQSIAKANEILAPYKIDVKHVAWSSVYEVGHRVTDGFDNVPEGSDEMPRVFIAGDACHTHSAKAGQGMNVSMQDTFNLGWKLGYVLTGRSPEDLLKTYSEERQVIAQDLIDFDREWSSMMAKNPEDFDDPGALGQWYQETFEFPMGFRTQYPNSVLVLDDKHQDLAPGYPVGKRFRSAEVMRVTDATKVHLGHKHKADGRWRIYAFADKGTPPNAEKTNQFADWLANSPDSPVVKYTRPGEDRDALFDAKVIYQANYMDVLIPEVPEIFRPLVGTYQVSDWNKVYAEGNGLDIFEEREINREEGVVVVVRPDMYVSAILPMSATDELAELFDGFLLPAEA